MRALIVNALVLGTFASGSLLAQPFFFRRDIPLTGRPASVAVGDFNGDHRPDLAVYSGYAEVALLLNQGKGDFARPIRTGVRLHWEGLIPGVLVGDFNGDGRDDLAITEGVFLSRGDGTFEPGQQFNVPSIAIRAAADFNGDGKSDLIAAGLSGMQVLLSKGDGTFRAAPTFNAMNASWAVVADFNRDGHWDVALSRGSDFVVFLGNGDGTFGLGSETHVDWLFSENFVSFTGPLPFADFNGDGLPDLVAPKGILLGKGDGSFQALIPYPSWGEGVYFTGYSAADFSGNGKASLILGRGGVSSIYICPGNGDGRLLPTPNEQPAGWSHNFSSGRVATADLDGDGRLDMVIANELSNTVSLLMAKAQGGPAFRRAVSAASGAAAVAPQSLATLFAPTPATATAIAVPPWPTRLAGISLEIQDSVGATHLAPLLFVSSTQVNFEVPAEIALGEATLAISTNAGVAQVGGMLVDRVAPALFMASPADAIPAATAIRVESDGTQVPIPVFTCSDSGQGTRCDFAAIPLAEAGDRPTYLSFYGTGLRNANPDTVSCFIGDVPLPVVYAGPQGIPGLDQINVRLLPGPWEGGGIGFGFHILTISVDGVASNAAWLTIL